MNNIDIRKYIINNFTNSTIEEIKASIEEGAKDFIQKPFLTSQIVGILKKRVEGL